MISLNPVMSSATLAASGAQNTETKPQLKMDNATQAQSSNSGNTTVTLSGSNPAKEISDYLSLNSQQTVRSGNSVSQDTDMRNETANSALTNSNFLMNRMNYAMQATTEVGSGQNTSEK